MIEVTVKFITGNSITVLPLLKNPTFSTAVHRVPDNIRNVRRIFEISDSRLLDALCDIKRKEKMMSDTGTRNGYGEKILLDPEHRY